MVDEMRRPILIVEDETIMRESLRDWLVDGGYHVETAVDGEEATKFISEREFSLVLLDLRLPKKNGIEVLRESREIRPQLKVIIITAYPSVETAVQAMKQGAVDYLTKPFDLDDLDKLIRGTLIPTTDSTKQTKNNMLTIPTLAVVKNEEGINVTFIGWEYIDAYLDLAKHG